MTSLPSPRRRPRRRCCRSSALTPLAGIVGAAVLARPALPARPPHCARVGVLRSPCPAPTMPCRVRLSVGGVPRARLRVRRRLVPARASVPWSSFRPPRPTCGGIARRSSSSRSAAGWSLWRTRAIGCGRPLARWSLLSTFFRGRLLSPMRPWRQRICLGSCTSRCRPRACRRRTCCGLSWLRCVALCPPTWSSSSVACPAPHTLPAVVVTPTLTVCLALWCPARVRAAWRTCFGVNSSPRSTGCAASLLGSPFSWKIHSAPCYGAIRRCTPSRRPSVLGSSLSITVWPPSLLRISPLALLRSRPGTWCLGIPRCPTYAVPPWAVPTDCRLRLVIAMPTSSSCLGARRVGGFRGRSVFPLGTLLGIRRASMVSSSLSHGGLVPYRRRRWSRRRRRRRWRLPTRPSVLRVFVSTASPRRPASTPPWSSMRSSAMCCRLLAWRPL